MLRYERMISIIIATYNGEKYIEKTIKSALAQKDVDIEIIVVDDASLDNSYIILTELSKCDSRIKVLRNDINIGFCKTVNRALRECKGEYVIILDQDDLLQPDHCEKMIKEFDNETVMVFCDSIYINGEDSVIDDHEHCVHREVTVEDLAKGNYVPVQGLMIAGNILKKVGGYPERDEFPNYGEYDTWIRMSEYGRIIFCDSVKAFYRRHESNMTNDFNSKNVRIKLERYYWQCKKRLLSNKKVDTTTKIKIIFSTILGMIKAIVM